jgi:hypothetical protein
LSLLEGDLTMREVMERAVRKTLATINVERMWVEANAQKYCEKLSTNGVLAKVNITSTSNCGSWRSNSTRRSRTSRRERRPSGRQSRGAPTPRMTKNS